jgi:hypothetical protein
MKNNAKYIDQGEEVSYGKGDVAPIFPLTRIGVSVILGHATRTKIG